MRFFYYYLIFSMSALFLMTDFVLGISFAQIHGEMFSHFSQIFFSAALCWRGLLRFKIIYRYSTGVVKSRDILVFTILFFKNRFCNSFCNSFCGVIVIISVLYVISFALSALVQPYIRTATSMLHVALCKSVPNMLDQI